VQLQPEADAEVFSSGIDFMQFFQSAPSRIEVPAASRAENRRSGEPSRAETERDIPFIQR
jgi:hypothetical protein